MCAGTRWLQVREILQWLHFRDVVPYDGVQSFYRLARWPFAVGQKHRRHSFVVPIPLTASQAEPPNHADPSRFFSYANGNGSSAHFPFHCTYSQYSSTLALVRVKGKSVETTFHQDSGNVISHHASQHRPELPNRSG